MSGGLTRLALAATVLTIGLAAPASARAPMSPQEFRAALDAPGGATLRGRHITGPAVIENATLTTRDVVFDDEVTIWLGGDSALDLRDTRFKGSVELISPEPPGLPCGHCSLKAGQVTFDGRVQFSGRFFNDQGKLELTDSTFSRPSVFAGNFTTLECTGCEFKSTATFTDATIERLDLTDAVFDEPPDFSHARLGAAELPCFRGKPLYITWSQLDRAWLQRKLDRAGGTGSGESFGPALGYQQLKNALLCWRDNLNAIGFQRDATEVHRAAVLIARDHLDSKPSTAWVFAWAPELIDGWGTRPWQPFVVGAGFVIVYFIAFATMSSYFEEAKPDPVAREPIVVFAFFYSVETFIPILKVTGVKDWGWRTKGPARWVEVSEAFVGAILSALAAYSFAAHVL
jgi:uncharacterized protein YjbI with pentapeptide repeats